MAAGRASLQDALLTDWNEPNYAAYGSVSVARMAELTNKAAAAIWQVDPGRKVVGPAASPGVHGWVSYMRALYRRLDRRIELAANIYPHGRILRNFRRDANAIRRIAGRRDYWITETNVSRAQVGPERQSRFVRVAYRYAQRKRLSGSSSTGSGLRSRSTRASFRGTRASRPWPATGRQPGSTGESAPCTPGSIRRPSNPTSPEATSSSPHRHRRR